MAELVLESKTRKIVGYRKFSVFLLKLCSSFTVQVGKKWVVAFPKTKVKRCLVCSEGGGLVWDCVRLVGYGSSYTSVLSQDLIFICFVSTTNICLMYPRRGPKNNVMLFYGYL